MAVSAHFGGRSRLIAIIYPDGRSVCVPKGLAELDQMARAFDVLGRWSLCRVVMSLCMNLSASALAWRIVA
jgi:hypothetical protein